MKKPFFLYLFVFVSYLLAIAAIYTMVQMYNTGLCVNRKYTTEGFADETEEGEEDEEGEDEGGKESKESKETAGNALVSIVAKLKIMSGYLTDPNMWSERMEMFQMDPMALARRELTKHKPKS